MDYPTDETVANEHVTNLDHITADIPTDKDQDA